MPTWIALFRGINVGGNNLLPMQALRELLESSGCTHVQTYIQSGNAVFDSNSRNATTLASKISKAVNAQHGFAPRVLVLSTAALDTCIANNPFAQADDEPNKVMLYFLAKAPAQPDLESLAKIQSPTERFKLIDQCCYLYAPDGIGRSKLAAQLERGLGVDATARNWRTVGKIRALLLS